MNLSFNIQFKLFLAILFLTCAAVGGMVVLLHESFDRTFLQYINRFEREAQNSLMLSLEHLYEENGSWEFIRNDQEKWNNLVIANFARIRITTPPGDDPFHNREETNEEGTETYIRSQPFRNRYYRSNVALLDADKSQIVGMHIEPQGAEFKPIIASNRTVGYLATKPLARIMEKPDVEFSRQQVKTFYIIAIGMALLTFILSIPLARYLVTRIQTLTNGTRELASGNYGITIPVKANDELGELSRDFNLLAKTLDKNEKARREWIADISHELRTPIAILRGEIEAIQDKIRAMTPETLENLHGEVMNLDRLVNDLFELSMSDIGALSYQKKELNIIDPLSHSISIYQDEFERKNIKLKILFDENDSITVFADRERLQQLFTNIIINSLRYTEENGIFEITLSRTEDHLQITFDDSPPSVPDDDMPKLFDRLFRVESSRNKFSGGTGLGLAICKNIVEAHEGRLSASKSPLGGVRISIELPRVS